MLKIFNNTLRMNSIQPQTNYFVHFFRSRRNPETQQLIKRINPWVFEKTVNQLQHHKGLIELFV